MEHTDEVVHVAETFGEVARLLGRHMDLDTTLTAIVTLAVEHLDACEFAGISLVCGRSIISSAASNDVPKTVDLIQSEVQEGPCIDAIKEHEVFLTGDLPAETRWPQFSTRAHDATGIRSILSLRLFRNEVTMGALNLYSTRPDAFDGTDIALGSVFAIHAAIAMSSALREDQLERKAATRDLIGKAKGILMTREGVDEAHAFSMLRRASQRLNVKLTEVARQVADRPESSESAVSLVDQD